MSLEFVFILVEPAVPENVGGAARALKTMGFRKLRLVRPSGFPSEKAYHVAHGSGEILEQATIYTRLEDALSDIDLAIATTSKRRAVRYEYLHAADLPDLIQSKAGSSRRTGIVFGREESGLSNAEMASCDIVSFIPMKHAYPSLNLAQAVMLYAYILSPFSIPRKRESKPAGEGKYRQMIRMAGTTLREIRFREDSNIYTRIFERLALLGDDDINLVLSFLDKLRKSQTNAG